ncbi:MAG: carbohydrate ABC transporter substrate-binding protein [Lachnospiraceae bacterium]|nr:carbohydrate ABC transporter substrate-binding protein [Lachnospiraceae bacterium]
MDKDYQVAFVGYADDAIPYTVTAVTPQLEIKDRDGNLLVQGIDYTVTYKNNKAVTTDPSKKAVAQIKGKGNYTGTLEKEFTIVKKVLTEDSKVVTIKVLDKVVKGGKNGWKQTFKVLDENGKVINKSEYDFKYTLDGSSTELKDTDSVSAGEKVRVTVTFKPDRTNYEGTISGDYRIIEKGYDISKATITILPQNYTGGEIELVSDSQFKETPYVKNGSEKLYLYLETKDGQEQNIEVVEGSYVKNVNKGTAKVTLRGTGEFGGEKTVSFKIVQRNVLSNWWKAFIGEADIPEKPEKPETDVTIKVAAIETAYGSDIWAQVADAFTEETGIMVDLTVDRNLEDVIGPSMQAGNYPDVVHLATGRPAGLTEQMINGNKLADITDVLSMKVPGETALVSEKLAGGFAETSLTNPYGNGKTYLAPMFYSPCGLFYNAGLLQEKGWELPATWDEMWELGEKAKRDGIALFTYPTTGYLDAFFYSLMYSIGGADFFDAATTYQEGVWETEEADKYFEIIGKLATYTHQQTPTFANNEDFTRNQQMVLNNQAIFMPNGTWIVGEMANASRAQGFKWGMTALPAVEPGGSGYSYSWFEQAWIPSGAENVDAAKKFVAFLYSDIACEIFASAGAIQPVRGLSNKLTGDNKMFYSIYDNGAKAAMGYFKAFSSIPGIEISSVFMEPMNDLVKGDLTIQNWRNNIRTASDSIRQSLQ